MLYKRILIPTDGSAISNEAARAGVDFAIDCKAEIIGIYVSPEYTYPVYADTVPPDYVPIEEYEASMVQMGESYLKEMRDAAFNAGLVFSSIVVFSNSPAVQIVDAAEKNNCDLIFMGSHGRGGISRLLLGSVTSKVLSTCRIPVLVYRSKRDTPR